jgi:hypothetical protein
MRHRRDDWIHHKSIIVEITHVTGYAAKWCGCPIGSEWSIQPHSTQNDRQFFGYPTTRHNTISHISITTDRGSLPVGPLSMTDFGCWCLPGLCRYLIHGLQWTSVLFWSLPSSTLHLLDTQIITPPSSILQRLCLYWDSILGFLDLLMITCLQIRNYPNVNLKNPIFSNSKRKETSCSQYKHFFFKPFPFKISF